MGLSTRCEKFLWRCVKNQNFFFELYAFIILTSTLVLGINYFVIITRPLHPMQVRKRSSSSCYMIERYNTHHRFPCYWTINSHILNGILGMQILPGIFFCLCYIIFQYSCSKVIVFYSINIARCGMWRGTFHSKLVSHFHGLKK